MRTKIRFAHFYRVSHGDSSIKPIPVFEQEDEAAIEAAIGQALLDRFNEPFRRMKPPHTADLVDENGALIFRLRTFDSTTVRRDLGKPI